MANAIDVASAWSGLGRQMFQGQANYEAGRMKAAEAAAKQSAFEGHANLYNAQAQKAQEDALASKQRRQYQTPEHANTLGATFAGLNGPQAAEMAQFQQQGNWGMNPERELPIGQEGPPMPSMPKQQPSWYSPEVKQLYDMGRMAQLAQLGATGNTDGNHIADMLGKFLSQGRIDQAIADPKYRANFGPAMAAAGGKGEFNNLGNNGVFNQFTGAQELNAIGTTAAQQNRAQANNANASAGQHAASAALARSKIGQPTINPDGSVTAPTGKPIKLSATAEKELFEADDNIKAGNSTIGLLKQAMELNDKAYSGYFAKSRAVARSNMPGESESANATINLDNIMTTQALESLKTTFGAAPTEGERKILLDIQASAEKTPAQRKALIERAIKASEQRLIFNTNKAKGLRSGSYNSVNPQEAPAQRGVGNIDALLNKYGG